MESTIPSVGVQGTRGQQAAETNQPLRELDLSEFIKLMVTELQNQDPLNPMENSEILSQISQIREIEASDKMTKTLESLRESQDAVLLAQSLTNAGALIGKNVKGQIEKKVGDEVTIENITGVADRVSIDAGKATIHVGEKKFPLSKLLEIQQPE